MAMSRDLMLQSVITVLSITLLVTVVFDAPNYIVEAVALNIVALVCVSGWRVWKRKEGP